MLVQCRNKQDSGDASELSLSQNMSRNDEPPHCTGPGVCSASCRRAGSRFQCGAMVPARMQSQG
eukprot:14500451-Alexandrium_andersonii.AAC.1